ncbi:MAG TPA: GNAT family N-acetyltransferase [Jatrophihabitans sp.]|jgi:GNAT superfamily N-acetyltransferase|uniref:GNAT family N-acetyltransferase n=1 Tax=Jatrophihabitans sp. TaxID=1932789 RepID=UPI002E092D7A|nr:GNAT family N-acetyltransferase [Jatrophihabitans sp.]
MPIRRAGPDDVPALARLRAAWTDEVADPEFEAEFARWWDAEAGRRAIWLAEVDGEPAGMLTLAEYRRMPRPGRPAGCWGYVGNVFVLAEQRDRGLGRALLDAVIAEARARDYVRLVLAPSERSIPLYRRAGFGAADGLLVLPLT